MNKIHKQRLGLISLFLLGLALATSLILYALKQNINVFLTPSQLAHTKIINDYSFRLGGIVKPGSVIRDKTGLGITFTVTDLKKDLTLRYVGVLPDLFKEGSGVIVQGSFNNQHQFTANLVLAKHDENYMPKNVYKIIRENAK